MTVVKINSTPKRRKPKPGDRKTIRGVEHIRCFSMVNVGTEHAPYYAYDHTGGRQNYEWVPIEEADVISCKRKRNK